MVDKAGRSRGAISYDDDNNYVYVAMGEDVQESQPNLIWALCNLTLNKICILHVHVPPLSIPFKSAMFLKSVGRENRIREYQTNERRKVENVINGYLKLCVQQGVPAEILFTTRDSVENGIIELICSHGIKKLLMGAKKAVYACRYAPNFCNIWVISKGFLTYTRHIHQGSPDTYQFNDGEMSPSSRSRRALSYEDDKDNDHVYVAMGEDVEESESNLIWALCNLKPKQICILHVHVPPLDVPFRSAMFLKSVGRENRITEYQEMERRKVENVVNGYLRLCDQAGVPGKIEYATRNSIENGIIELICTHGIKKLVMGAKKAVYICKYAPNFCYIWVTFKGFLTYTRQNEFIEEVKITHQESPNGYHFEGKSPREEAGEVALQTISNVSSSVEFCVTSLPSEKDKSSSLSLPSLGKSGYVNEGHNGSSTFSITGKIINQDFYDKLEQTSLEIGQFKRESYEDSIKRKKFEMETITVQQREREFRTMFCEELDQRIEFEFDLERTKEEAEKMTFYLNKVNDNLQASKQENSSLESRIESSNKTVKEIENKMVVAADLSNKFKEEKEQFHVEKRNAEKFASQLREREVDTESSSLMLMPRFFLDISITEIQEATKNFDPKLKVLQDDFICTYIGFLRNNQVLVKKFRPFMWEGTSMFHEEVTILSMLRHPNLIMLMGVCTEKWAIVYEHLPNGSLEDRLNCKENTPPLPWQTRIQIATELCSVLMFLHSCTPNAIIYGDLKPSNVLLDENFKGKLGDLGICRPNDVAAYDFAYMDPEFLATGELTPQSNVYSFGVILLRLLTGRLAPGLTTEIQNALAEGNLENLFDPTAGEWPFEQASQLFHLAMSCVEVKPWRRPNLAFEVWTILESMTTSRQTTKFLKSAGEKSEDSPTSFLCPINQEVMEVPVIAADGFSYEEEAIKEWFGGGHDTSPMTNLKLPNCNLVPNHALRSAISAWLLHQI